MTKNTHTHTHHTLVFFSIKPSSNRTQPSFRTCSCCSILSNIPEYCHSMCRVRNRSECRLQEAQIRLERKMAHIFLGTLRKEPVFFA